MKQRYIYKGPVWLQVGASTSLTQIIEPEKDWLITDDAGSGIIHATVYSLSSGADLVFEGSNTADGWFEIGRISDPGTRPIGLLTSYPQSDGKGHLWDRVRWAWRAATTGDTLADEYVCFELKTVLKP